MGGKRGAVSMGFPTRFHHPICLIPSPMPHFYRNVSKNLLAEGHLSVEDGSVIFPILSLNLLVIWVKQLL